MISIHNWRMQCKIIYPFRIVFQNILLAQLQQLSLCSKFPVLHSHRVGTAQCQWKPVANWNRWISLWGKLSWGKILLRSYNCFLRSGYVIVCAIIRKCIRIIYSFLLFSKSAIQISPLRPLFCRAFCVSNWHQIQRASTPIEIGRFTVDPNLLK